jgi:hypothetical protein
VGWSKAGNLLDKSNYEVNPVSILNTALYLMKSFFFFLFFFFYKWHTSSRAKLDFNSLVANGSFWCLKFGLFYLT